MVPEHDDALGGRGSCVRAQRISPHGAYFIDCGLLAGARRAYLDRERGGREISGLALVGSTNLDSRTLFLNYELMVAFHDAWFDLERSTQMDRVATVITKL